MSRTDGVESERDRKQEHIELSLDGGIQLGVNFFDRYAFDHQALPEIALDEIDLSVEFLGRRLEAPLLISCMTGGTGQASAINRNLAIAAQETRIALGVGSQRKALEDPEQAASFEVRPHCPDVPVLANLGAVQLNYGFGIDQCRAAVEMVEADALVFHLNPLQEAIQPEGQCDFRGLTAKMAAIGGRLEVPLVAKEIGCGLSRRAGEQLHEAGVRIVDAAGLGGTSWARIEARRAADVELGELFAGWGVPTPRSIRELASIEGMTVIGSGGVRSGVDAAKAIALGADLVGLAQPFLAAAVESPELAVAAARRIAHELRIAMFCVGARSVDELRRTELHEVDFLARSPR